MTIISKMRILDLVGKQRKVGMGFIEKYGFWQSSMPTAQTVLFNKPRIS